MVTFRVSGFAGAVPRLQRRALGERQAQIAMNCVLTAGDLRPINLPKAVSAALTTDTVSVFRMAAAGVEKWLSWDRDVDVARGPISGDTSQRIYWTGDGEPRASDFATATSGGGPYPTAAYVLGVFPPSVAPSVAYTGTVGTATDRAFVYTFVNAWGEESAPSPASAVVSGGNSGAGQWGLTALQTAPANSFTATGATWSSGTLTYTGISSTFGLRVGEEIAVTGFTPSAMNVSREKITGLTATTVSIAMTSSPGAYSAGGTITRKASHNTSAWKQRFYWTETTTSGTEYQFVLEQNAASTATIDADTTASEALPSAEWAMPPVDMHSIGVLPNGIMYGASKNQLCLSLPNKPYAWPTRFQQPADFQIVGLGSFGTTIVAATEGTPYTLSGVDPDTMGGGMTQIKQEWPCVAKRSVAALGVGVVFAAPQGLALIGIGGADIVTRDIYTQREWQGLAPSTFVAAVRDGRYYAGYMPSSGRAAMLTIDKGEFASLYFADYAIDEAWTDPLSGKLYIVADNVLSEWEGDIGQRNLYDWMSREFVFNPPINLGAAKVDADFASSEAETTEALSAYTAAVAANQAIINAGTTFGAVSEMEIGVLPVGGDTMGDVPVVGFDSCQFNLYVDNRLVFTTPVTNSRAFRLPSGYKSDNCAIRLSGNVKINGVVLAETMIGLKSA